GFALACSPATSAGPDGAALRPGRVARHGLEVARKTRSSVAEGAVVYPAAPSSCGGCRACWMSADDRTIRIALWWGWTKPARLLDEVHTPRPSAPCWPAR